MTLQIAKVRDDDQIACFSELVWEFFDFLRERYPDMLPEIEDYISHNNVIEELAAFREYYNPPAGEAFLALRENDPVGICLLRPHAHGGAEFNRMYVRPSARGLGVGRKLAVAVIGEARALGYDTLCLGALYRHTEALPLYESLGFEKYSPEHLLHADDDRVIHMRMKL